MKLVKFIENDYCNISLFSINNKYILKFEIANLEQSYKVSEYDVSNEQDFEKMLTPEFMEKIMNRFKEMHTDFNDTLENID